MIHNNRERARKLLGLKAGSSEDEIFSSFFDYMIDFFEKEKKQISEPTNQTLSSTNVLPSPYEMEQKKLKAYEGMSWDELDKGNHLAKLKSISPSHYAKLFEQRFGKKPQSK